MVVIIYEFLAEALWIILFFSYFIKSNENKKKVSQKINVQKNRR